MRIMEEKVSIDYDKTKQFFKKRAEKYNQDNPYGVTMYQDNNQQLVIERNNSEIGKLLPKLNISEKSKVLDVACGVGRWADTLPDSVCEYCGVDFSEELIEIANQRNTRSNFSFYVGSAVDIKSVLKSNGKGKCNVILAVGILMYLNDQDVMQVLQSIANICEEHAVICIREPIGLQNRLTLKEFYSEELHDNYNAIYRTKEEFTNFFTNTLFFHGFTVKAEGFLFEEDALNNRKETSQYYFVLER